MAENYMQLLNHGAQVTSDAFNRIDQAMTQNLQVQQRAGEFAAEMTAKAATFAEGARMNDAQITSMKQANYIRGQEFLLRQQLVPLERQEQIMRLELMKEQKQGRLEAQKVAQFNMMTQAYEPMIHDTILKTMSPQLASEYAQYRGKWIGHVANGGGFDGPTYEQGLKKVIGKYSHLKPVDKPWNAQDKFMLERIHPALGQAYDLQNPFLKEHKTGLASAYLGMTQAQAGEFMGKYKTLYSETELGMITPARVRFQANANEIEKSQNALVRLRSDYSVASEEERPFFEKQIIAHEKNIEQKLNQNEYMASNHAMGKYGISDKPIDAPDKVPEEPAEVTKYVEVPPIAGFAQPKRRDPVATAKFTRLGELKTILTVPGAGEEKTIDLLSVAHPDKDHLKWFADNNKPIDEPTMKNFVANFEDAINQKEEALDDIVTEENFNKLLATIKKPIQVPLTEYLKSTENSLPGITRKIEEPDLNLNTKYFTREEDPSFDPIFGNHGKGKSSSIKLGNDGTNQSVKSFKDVLNIVSGIKNKAHREQATKDIFALIAAGATASALGPQ